MFYLDSDWINFGVVVYFVVAYSWIKHKSATPPQQKVVNWEEVVALEHELGMLHSSDSKPYCWKAECKYPPADRVLSRSGVETLARGLALGVLGPNETRKVCEPNKGRYFKKSGEEVFFASDVPEETRINYMLGKDSFGRRLQATTYPGPDFDIVDDHHKSSVAKFGLEFNARLDGRPHTAQDDKKTGCTPSPTGGDCGDCF